MKLKRILAILMTVIMLLPTVVMADSGTTAFSDVSEKHWAYMYISKLSSAGVITGYPDGTFKPDATVTRAEWAKMLYIAGELDYADIFSDADEYDYESLFYQNVLDVSKSDWYAKYASVVAFCMPVYTLEDYTFYFAPDEEATREDVTVSLADAVDHGLQNADISVLSKFTDTESINEGFEDEIAIAVELGLVSGYPDNTFRPQNTLTRAEAATLLYRAFYANEKEATANDPEEQAAVEAAINGYVRNITSLNKKVLDYIAKDTELYSYVEEILGSVDMGVLVDEMIDAMGMPEKYNEEIEKIVTDFYNKALGNSKLEIKSVEIDGDTASVEGVMTAIDLNNMSQVYEDMDIWSFLTEEEMLEIAAESENMTEAQQQEYAYEIVLEVLPRVFDAIIEDSKTIETTATIKLNKIDGAWLVVEDI